MQIQMTHVGVYTMDLERLRAFYETYFQAESNTKYEHDGFSSYFLRFSDGARMELMSHTRLTHREPQEYVNGISHLAFSLGSREAVTALTERLVRDGYPLLSPLRDTGDGYFESCIGDPDGNRIELTI